MKAIGRCIFPENRDEALEWKPEVLYRGLGGGNSQPGQVAILAAAQTRIEGAWKAYILVVPGQDFASEYREVLRIGTPLDEDVADVLFPYFGDIPYAR